MKDLPTEDTDIQDNFIDFINDISEEQILILCLQAHFWISMMDSYPHLANVVLKLILSFPTTYKCETAFTTLLNLKCKTRNKMASVDSEMRMASSQTQPNIVELAKSTVIHPSH